AAFEAHADYIRSIAVHPTQPFVLTSSDDMLIKLWDWERGWKNIQVWFHPLRRSGYAAAAVLSNLFLLPFIPLHGFRSTRATTTMLCRSLSTPRTLTHSPVRRSTGPSRYDPSRKGMCRLLAAMKLISVH